MAFKVAGTNPRGDYNFEYEKEALEPIGAEVVTIRSSDPTEYAGLIADMDAVIIGTGMRYTSELMSKLTRCKVIMSGAVGFDRIDVDAATAAGILVINVPDVWVEEVADHAMMLLLAVARKLVYSNRIANTAQWPRVYEGFAPIPRLQESTLGLVAFGTIARNVARRAKAFGIRVIATDPVVPDSVFAEAGVERKSMDEVFRESDFVSAHVPHSKATHHLIGASHFAQMKPNSIFLNTGRGAVVDEPALIAALKAGRPSAAGLDVLEQEPPQADNPLLSMPNVLVTPHTAYYSDAAFIASRRRVGEEIAAVLTGTKPRNPVNPAVLARLGLA
ncbi:MAG: C-terminal binding protein [Chloroflexota bacterium]